jgi:hypothetical protein
VMGEEEEEGKRTMEDRYKELRPHFASISLVTPPLDAHKIIHFAGVCRKCHRVPEMLQSQNPIGEKADALSQTWPPLFVMILPHLAKSSMTGG